MKSKIVFAILVLGVLLTSGCMEKGLDTVQPGRDGRCGMENCHGLDILCGPNVPAVCTEMYALGDFCRAHASCEFVDGKCQLVKKAEFDQCKECVKNCNKLSGPEAFDCENDCRNIFE